MRRARIGDLFTLIPWDVKDLLAVRGTRTTWGMSPYKERVIDTDTTAYRKLTEAGAVLLAKLSTGALAVSARWHGGLTRNPWNTEQDAAGSSVSTGSDTGGSIIFLSMRNGCTGLRPTFGRVSRYGAMALAWTQDTIGPMCRSAEDCDIVFDAIHGPDGKDNSVRGVPFTWDGTADVTKLRVGLLRSVLEGDVPEPVRRNHEYAAAVLRSLGVELVPFELPEVPLEGIDYLRYAETAAAFEDVTRSGLLTDVEEGPEKSRRPIEIRAAHFTPAVEWIQGNRLRMRAMKQVHEAMGDLDLFVGSRQALTNRTGHLVISFPNGFHRGSPTALQLTGKLFGEPEILLLASAFQAHTDHHRKHPPR